jgi:hypothetical protein
VVVEHGRGAGSGSVATSPSRGSYNRVRGGEVRRCRVRGAGGTKREGGGGGWVSAHGRAVVTHDTLRLGHVRTSLACVG